MDTTMQQSLENQPTPSQQPTQKIKPNTLHLAGFKELLRSATKIQDKMSFSADTFYSPQSQSLESIVPHLRISDLCPVIRRGIPHKDWPHAQNVKLSVYGSLISHTDVLKDSMKMISIITNNFTQVKNLDLVWSDWESMSNKYMLPSLGREIGRKLVNLKHLSLTLGGSSIQGLPSLVKEISRNIVGLNTLHLNFKVYRFCINNDQLRQMASEISKRLIELRSLSFDFTEGNSIKANSKGIEGFISKITRLERLQKLKLCFPSSKISEEDLKKSIRAICKNLTCLQYLEFRFKYGSKKFSHKTLCFILAEITQNLVLLEHLDFNFYCSDMLPERTDHLYTFKQLNNLKTFKLTLDSSMTLNPVLLSLSSIITENFINLEVFDIKMGLPIEAIRQVSLEALIFATSRSLKSLHTLHVEYCPHNFLRDISIDHNAQKLISRLKYLTLSFRHCKHLSLNFEAHSIEALPSLVTEISRNLIDLESLHLNVAGTAEDRVIDDEQVIEMASEISRGLTELRSLSFDLTKVRFTRISSKGIQEFISQIARLKSLQKLEFYFPNSEISEEALEKSIDAICKNLTCLRYLVFRFNYGFKFPHRTLWFILSEITQNLVLLEHLDFNFYCSDMLSETTDHLYTFKQLNNLKTFKLVLDSNMTLNPLLSSLSSITSSNFPNLDVLDIRMGSSIEMIKQVSLEALIFDTSCSLTHLQTLHIGFSSCNFQTDSWKTLIDHDSSKKPASRLKHLTLECRYCKNLTECFLEALGAGVIFYLSSLESLMVSYKDSKTQKQGLEMFEQRIRKGIPSLKSLKIIAGTGKPGI